MKTLLKDLLSDFTEEVFPDIVMWVGKLSPFLGTVIFTELFQKYIFSDFNYLFFLGVVVVLDVLSKFYYLWDNKKPFEFKKLVKKFTLKLLKYFIFVSAMHVFLKLEVEGRVMEYGFYVKYLVYSLLITSDVKSILGNLGITLPKEIAKYLDKDKDEEVKTDLKTFADGGDVNNGGGGN